MTPVDLEQPGVYLIRHKPTGHLYVGGTRRPLRLRISEHQTQLARGVCSVPRLQAAVDLTGIDSIEIIPVRNFPAHAVHEKEKELIARLVPHLNANLHGAAPNQRKVRESTEKIEVDGVLTTYAEVARLTGLSRQVLMSRYRRGLRGDDLVAPPHRAKRKVYTRHK